MCKILKRKKWLKIFVIGIISVGFCLFSGCNKKSNHTLISSEVQIDEEKLLKNSREGPNFRENFDKAIEKNSDTVAWIHIPGTDISYPVVQDLQKRGKGKEHYYEHRTFEGDKVEVGKESAIMSMNDNILFPFDKLSSNVVISGHNVNLKDIPNHKMFAPLLNFRDLEFSKNTPYIFLTTKDKDLVYEVFASGNMEERFDYYIPKNSEKEVEAMIKEVKERSNFIYDDVKVNGKDKILTLYACTYSDGKGNFWKYLSRQYYRIKFVVQARLLSEDNIFKKEANVKENPSPKKPFWNY